MAKKARLRGEQITYFVESMTGDVVDWAQSGAQTGDPHTMDLGQYRKLESEGKLGVELELVPDPEFVAPPEIVRSQEELNEIRRRIGKPEKAVDSKPAAPTKVAAPSVSSATPQSASEHAATAVVEFKILLAEHRANPDNLEARVACEAVGNFILAVWPELEPELTQAQQRKRFSLG